MGNFLTDLFIQFNQEEQGEIKAAKNSALKILAQGKAAAQDRRRAAGSPNQGDWVLQPERDAQADAGRSVFSAYANALWRGTDAASVDNIHDFRVKVDKLIDPVLTKYPSSKDGVDELRGKCHVNAELIHFVLRKRLATETSSTQDSSAGSSRDGTNCASRHTNAMDATEQSDTEMGHCCELDDLVMAVQPPSILDFSTSWCKIRRGRADEAAMYTRHLGREGPEWAESERLLTNAQAWAEPVLREIASEERNVFALKERVVRMVFDKFVEKGSYFWPRYEKFGSALWHEGWPSLEDRAILAIRSCKPSEATALLKRADGTLYESVNFPTAEKYANIGPRRRQQLINDDTFEVVGKGRKRRITVRSLIAYCPSGEKTE